MTEQEWLEKARQAIDTLRDFAREHGMDYRQRDPLVMAIHDALDRLARPALPGAEDEVRLADIESDVTDWGRTFEEQPGVRMVRLDDAKWLTGYARHVTRLLADALQENGYEAGREQGRREAAERCRQIAAEYAPGSASTAYHVTLSIAREFNLPRGH